MKTTHDIDHNKIPFAADPRNIEGEDLFLILNGIKSLFLLKFGDNNNSNNNFFTKFQIEKIKHFFYLRRAYLKTFIKKEGHSKFKSQKNTFWLFKGFTNVCIRDLDKLNLI